MPRALALPLAAAAAWLLVCLALPSRYLNFDGTACAMAVELGDARNLVHGSHLSYGVLARAAYLLAEGLGYKGRAVFALQALNALISAASLALFLRLLLRLGCRKLPASLASAGLAFSYAFWYYSTEPQVYPLALLLLLAAASAGLEDGPAPALTGALHGLAVTGHVLAACAAPAFIWRLWTRGPAEGRPRRLSLYAAAGAAVAVACYAAATVVVEPDSLGRWWHWMLGTAAPPPGRSFAWPGLPAPGTWLQGLVHTAWAQPGSLVLRVEAGPLFLLQFALTWTAAGLALASARRDLAIFFGLWLAGHLAFVMAWEPANPNYHLGDLAALWAGIGLGLGLPLTPDTADAVAKAPQRAGRGWLMPAAALLVALLACNNLVFGLLPHAAAGSNPYRRAAALIAASTPEDAWIATLDSPAMVYVPYFALRRPWILPRNPRPPPPGDPVFALAEAVSDPVWGPRLAGVFDMTPVGGGAGLYRLAPKKRRPFAIVSPDGAALRRTPP